MVCTEANSVLPDYNLADWLVPMQTEIFKRRQVMLTWTFPRIPVFNHLGKPVICVSGFATFRTTDIVLLFFIVKTYCIILYEESVPSLSGR